MEYFNTYYPSNPPVDPLVGKVILKLYFLIILYII